MVHRLDASRYKQHLVPRGYTYNYYFHPPRDHGKPTLLFLHGFPSTSHDWTAQVNHLTNLGYGAIVPDLLGYGGTDKPKDWKEYTAVEIVKDVFSLVKHELGSKLQGTENWKVVLVAHDWGSILASRFIDLYPTHIRAAVFLALAYWQAPPSPAFDLEQLLDHSLATTGSDRFGYWELFSADDGPGLMDRQAESTWDLLFPDNNDVQKDEMAPRGRARAWVESGRRRSVPAWWTEEARRDHLENIMKNGGLHGPCAYYKCFVHGLQYDPSLLNLPMTGKHTFSTIYLAALQDTICEYQVHAEDTKTILADPEKQFSVKTFDTGHWMMMEQPNEVNAAIEEFLETTH